MAQFKAKVVKIDRVSNKVKLTVEPLESVYVVQNSDHIDTAIEVNDIVNVIILQSLVVEEV